MISAASFDVNTIKTGHIKNETIMKHFLLALALSLSGGIAAHGQIAYHDINPDTTVSTWDAFQMSPAGSSSGQLIIWYHPTPEVVVQSMGNLEVLFNGSLPAKLNLNDSITAGSGTWQAADYDALNSVGTGNWQTNATDKYLGFRFQNATGYNYGWLRMSVASGASSFTVKEYGYNTQVGKLVKAGQISTTGVGNSLAGENIQLELSGRKMSLLNATGSVGYPVLISDMSGRVVRQLQMYADRAVALDGLSTGNYIVHVAANGYV